MSGKKNSKAMLEKSGWQEGKGLGRNEQGEAEHVKVQQKDGVLGLGYNSQVQQVWSVQSVEYADVLARINAKDDDKKDDDDDDDDDDDQPLKRKTDGPAAGKHSVAYNKRRRLKTEGLTSEGGKAEIIAHAKSTATGSRRQRVEVSDDDSSDEDGQKKKKNAGPESTLVSPLLKRLCERTGTHEPKKRSPEDAVVTVKMPEGGKPAKCTETPFQYSRE